MRTCFLVLVLAVLVSADDISSLNLVADWDLYSADGLATTISDGSGSGNTLTLANAPNAPTWNPYLTFAASTAQRADATFSTCSATQPFTIFTIHNTASIGGLIWDGRTTNTFQFLESGDYQYGLGSTLTVPFAPAIGTWETIAVVHNGLRSVVYRNGIGIDWGNVGTGTLSLLRFGNKHSLDAAYNGSIARARVYCRGISDAEALQLHNYFLSLYAARSPSLTIPAAPTSGPIENAANIQPEFNWVAQTFGFIFHWNMSTFAGAQWADPDLNPNTFAPSGLNMDQWLDAVVTAGGRYAILTTKHHDGFALWPTAYAHPNATDVAKRVPYGVARTTWYSNNGSPDVVSLFVTKCRARGLNPILYFSIWDRTFETRSGLTAATGTAQYLSMIQTQLAELLTNYGTIPALWIDGWGWTGAPTTPGASTGGVNGYVNFPYATIYGYIKSVQPNCLILENNHRHPRSNSQIEVREQPHVNDGMVPSGNTRPTDVIDPIRVDQTDWFYIAADDQSAASVRTTADLASSITTAASRFATYTIAYTPTDAGIIPVVQTNATAPLAALVYVGSAARRGNSNLRGAAVQK